MRDTCLIVGQMPDPHVDALAAELRLLGVGVVILDSFPDAADATSISYSFEPGAGSVLRLVDAGRIYGREDIAAVFWRVKAPLRGLASANPDAHDFDFRFKEWDKLVWGLSDALPEARWINPLDAHARAGNKLRQLEAATALGLKIPRTVVGNRAEDVRALFAAGEVIYKTLSHPFYTGRRLILTTKISRDHFEDHTARVAAAPCLFQNYVEKDHELRVTVVGDSIVAMKVRSQAFDTTAVDWRLDQCRDGLYEFVTLPEAVAAQVLALMRRLDLVYGALDFIVTPAGDYIFLEVNPGGQWLWLEELTGVPITREIAVQVSRHGVPQFAC